MRKISYSLLNAFLIVLTLYVLLITTRDALNWITNKHMYEYVSNYECLMCVYKVVCEARDEACSDVWKKGAVHEDGVSAAARLGHCVVHSIDRMHPSYCYGDIHAVFQADKIQRSKSSWTILDLSGVPLEAMWCDDEQSSRLSDGVKGVRFGNLYVWSRGRNGKNEFGFGDDVCISPPPTSMNEVGAVGDVVSVANLTDDEK